jgi:hypothetical protein
MASGGHSHRYNNSGGHLIVITTQDSTLSRLASGISLSCCTRNLHAFGANKVPRRNIATAHAIQQQMCKATLSPTHSSSWARKEHAVALSNDRSSAKP